MTDTLNLTATQLKICRCVASGMKPREIANHLNLSPYTITNALFNIYDELEDHGYRRNQTQLAILYINSPELFKVRITKQNQLNGKKFFAIQMLKTRCNYRSVSDRLGISLSSVAVYKSNIPENEFYTLPYLHKM